MKKTNLKTARLENGAREADMAELLNISVNEYIDKENGVISLSNGEKQILSEYYGQNVFENTFM
ncbi:helix-turn-helix domain-containing protein [Clostridium sp. ZS2-4]|uniref:helix-turn-helix domain-containing protein n=1 Tax=Clostridium sp. ZS2-4 TaxID=2987703 RepID=UPI00227D2273|nr:helix-turn-helix transcriptional regulator [Clostridium sp. ZS2-4]MCY6354636.1 hypothetical protein [Clostridium sp. ZS2-4]